MKPFLYTAFLLLPVCLGCQGGRLIREGVDTRSAILELYTEQAMDNLVRARCNLPFVQLAYRNLGVQDADTLGGSLNDAVGTTMNTSRGPTGALAALSRSFSNNLTLNGSTNRTKTLSYSADPITDKNDIYLYYLAFANDPGLLVESCEKPKCGCHLVRQFHNKYYWIPESAAPLFLQLVLKTAMMRGPEIVPPPYYDRKIVKAHLVQPQGDNEVWIIEFDQPIPFGDATMVLTLHKVRYRQGLTYFNEPLKSTEGREFPALKEGAASTYLRATMPKKLPYQREELQNVPVQILSYDYPPEVPRPSPELQRLQDSVESLNLNLKNLAAPR
jgi:hypothetical protein